MAATPESLQSFVQYCEKHIKGDEKSEAQTFLTRFFQAFGHEGVKEIGAEFEERVKKGSKKNKTGFADLVWKPDIGVKGVVIEMKSRGINLSLHYSQLEKYWMRLTPKPRYSILCNFDEFWIYDFTNQVDEPVDRVKLTELSNRIGTFSFMEIGGRDPIFRNNQVEVTERTAKRMGEFYRLVRDRGKKERFKYFTEEQLQRFTLQCVLAMFAEDRHLLPRDLFVGLVQDCLTGKENAYDIFAGLFHAMNEPEIVPQGRYEGVDYFNGGLFSQIKPIPLERSELEILDVCARDNWANIRPSIFGNIFESAIAADERHAHGIHYTSETDIRQIVRPTISDYWEDKIENANNIGELNALQLELQQYKVLDPACGSGNFLYVAYQELKRIEQLLIQKIGDRRKVAPSQIEMGFVTPLQFFGMDTNPFAVQLARVTMMIARKIAIDKFELNEPALPLDSLDKNIVCEDALFTDWQKADAIIGNPPFLGGNRMREELGDQYIKKLFTTYPKVVDQVDYCVYWFRLAHEHISASGRAGLLATQSASEGKSRVAALDYLIQNKGYIYNAISRQDWSGDAQLDVCFINWSKTASDELVLDGINVSNITSALRSGIDTSKAVRLKVTQNLCFEGVKPGGKGFIINLEMVNLWTQKSEKSNIEVLKPLIDTITLAKKVAANPTRWIIDFADFSIEKANEYKLPFEHIKQKVKPVRDENRRPTRRENWWKFSEVVPKLRKALKFKNNYIAFPAHSKWFIPLMVPVRYLPNNSVKAVVSDDFFVLGVLTSSIHRNWITAQKSTLEDRTRYTHTSCFETFPFPQTATKKLTEQIRQAAIDLHEYRSEQMKAKQWGITKLYNAFFHEPASQLYKHHKKLDELVLKAYGFKKDDDILEKLLHLNLELAEKEKNGEKIIGPWAMDNPPKP